MLRVRALGPCTIAGFRTLLRGEVCDVPDERQEHVERLRIAGRVELLEAERAESGAAEPSGDDAPTGTDDSSPAPAALDDASAELARLEAELAELEQKPAEPEPEPATELAAPKRPLVLCVFCGKSFQEHAKGKAPKDAVGCAGLRPLFKPAPRAAS